MNGILIRTDLGDGFSFKVRALLVLALLTGLSVLAQPYGLAQRPVVGAFLNGVLPPAEANATPTGWQAVEAFPNLTFADPMTIVPEPGSSRLYVCERQGKIYFFTNTPSVSVKTLFLDLTAVTQGYNDCGLLGMAFHPQYGVPGNTNRGYVYVYYSYSPSPVGPGAGGQAPDATPNYNRLSRFTVPDGSLIADRNSELVLINQFDRNLWHNGGGICFGADGFLYLTNGDEGAANDSYNQAQKINAGFFSGVLRIDVDMDPTKSHPIRRQPLSGANPPNGWPPSYTTNYFVPNDNPWVNPDGSVLEEFYAIGLRSPHRMTYDALTDRLWLGDVGQGTAEEVSLIESGGNYQWAYREGNNNGPKSKPNSIIGTDKPPVYEYFHNNGNNCVIGGYVYRGAQFPTLYGKYIFGDNGSGRVWAMTYGGGPTVVTQLCVMPAPANTYGLASFGVDQNNEIYMAIVGASTKLYKLAASGAQPPPPPPLLSQTGVFTNLLSMAPDTVMIPFDINAPLWSDHAAKQRWMIVPNDGAPYGADETIGYTSNGNWSFPTGTVLVKHFDLPVNDTNPAAFKRLETRFLVYGTNAEWFGFTYKWRADNSDADLLPGGLNETNLITTATGVRTQVWSYPSRSDCRTCHTANAGGVLGPRTGQLNGDNFYPATGLTDNQLRALNHIGMFNTNLNEELIPTLPRHRPLTDTNASLELRVRSYLDANCAHCHRPNGVRGNFDARFSTPLENQGLINGSVADNLGISGARVIRPQSLPQSILYLRDNTLGGIAMPPLAKNVVDTNYINVLAAWINSLPPVIDLPSGLPGLVGNTNTSTASDNLYAGAAYINAARFQAASNFTAAFIRARVTNITGSYKCAIYGGTSTTPGALLGTTDELLNPATGWQTFTVGSPFTLTNGSYYWLAIWSDSPNARIFHSGTGGSALVRWDQENYGPWPTSLNTEGPGTFNYSLYASSGVKPVFQGTPANRIIGLGTQLVVTNFATDADAPTQSLSYFLLNPPTDASINGDGVITWMPAPAQASSTNLITTAVTDGIFSVTNSFQVIVTNVNQPPMAGADVLARWLTQGLTVPTSQLLTNDTDPDNDILTVVSLTNVSPAGATLLHSNSLVTYWPVFGDTNAGGFNYIITDGHNGYATGLVSVTVLPDPAGDDVLALTAQPGAEVVVGLTGIPGFTYTVQHTDTLTPPAWQNLLVVTANELGQINVTNTMPEGSTNRFYRAVRGVAP